MSLNRALGEPHPLGFKHRVVPVSKYRDLDNVRVPYEVMQGKQFKTPKVISRPIFEDAVARAREAFEEAGAVFGNHRLRLSFPEDAILVQEYPEQHQVEFIFARSVAGEEMFVRIPPYTLPRDVIGWLKATARWADLKVN